MILIEERHAINLLANVNKYRGMLSVERVNVIKCNVNPTLPANNFVFLRSTYVIITNN